MKQILTEYCVEEEAEKQKEAVLKFLSDYKEQEKLQFELTASIGYVCNSGMDATVELDDLYQAADKKMYDIKSKKHSKTSKRSRIIWGNI